MREETEGFAKLVLELNLEATKPLELQSSSRLYDNVLALIGTCCLYLYLPMSIFFFFFFVKATLIWTRIECSMSSWKPLQATTKMPRSYLST